MNKLKQYIEDNCEEIFITGGVSDEQIREMEIRLDLEFCEPVYRFLSMFGMILAYGVEILGCGKNGISSMVSETKRFRDYGLEKNFLVVQNVDEWIYCINNDTGAVSSWDRIDKKHIICETDFENYILNELIEAKEAWQEED